MVAIILFLLFILFMAFPLALFFAGMTGASFSFWFVFLFIVFIIGGIIQYRINKNKGK